MRLLFLFVCLLCSNFRVLADIGDTVKIGDIYIQDNKLKLYKNITKISPQLLEEFKRQNLQQLLQENTSVQFKTYGVSGSSLMSIRGANASHSKVVWNGLNLGSSLLNLNDVSLIPINTADDVQIIKGGNSAEQGSGALSGYISIESNKIDSVQQLSLHYFYNSLQNQQSQIQYSFKKKSFFYKTFLVVNNQENNYQYQNYSEFGKPKQDQINSELKQFALIQSVFYKKDKINFDAHFWYQESDRNLSPAIYNRNKNSYQLDNSFRSILNFNYVLNTHLKLKHSVGFTREILRYVSRIRNNNLNFVMLNTRSYFDNVQFNSNLNYNLNHFNQNILFQFVHDGAYVEDYNGYITRSRLTIASLSEFTNIKSFGFQFNNRIEKGISDYDESNFASSIQLNYKVPFKLNVQPYVRISKNYNIPGMNDLYWNPGGNPDLKSEKSFEKEIGVNYVITNKIINNDFHISLYQSDVTDWILWQPSNTENGIWSPENLRRVNLNGLELENTFKIKISNHQIVFNSYYSRTNAINKEAISTNDNSVNKQLIYVPIEKWGLNLTYNFNHYSFIIKHHFVSHRFTSSDNLQFLNSYALTDLSISKRMIFDKHNFNFQVYIDNLLNKTYESIPFHIMPARVFGFGLSYQLIKN